MHEGRGFLLKMHTNNRTITPAKSQISIWIEYTSSHPSSAEDRAMVFRILKLMNGHVPVTPPQMWTWIHLFNYHQCTKAQPSENRKQWATKIAKKIHREIANFFQRIKIKKADPSLKDTPVLRIDSTKMSQPIDVGNLNTKLTELVAACDPLINLPQQSSAIVCPRCKSGKHITIERKQIRRPDEPQTVVYSCSNHGVAHTWR